MDALLQAADQVTRGDISTEDAACALVASLRWPEGARCPLCKKPCTREAVRLTCEKGHVFTLFMGTALGSLRRPRVLALLRAIRAMSLSHRSVSARELARDVGMPHNTLWRHLHRLRKLMPRPPAIVLPRAGVVRIGDTPLAVAARNAIDLAASCAGGRHTRIVGESIRTWINGTFHGVSGSWLHRYAQEIAARWTYGAPLVDTLLGALVAPAHPLWFERHVRPRDAPLTFEGATGSQPPPR